METVRSIGPTGRCWGLLACVLAAAPAAASTFNISPIRAELAAARRTDVLTLTNADDRPVVVQVRVVGWSQRDGEEQLEDSREILVTPPVLQIAANGEQIVRVALRRDPDPARELSYRVIFEEVPQAAPKDFTGLQVALRLSVPVFVAPDKVKASPELAWESRWLPNGQLEVAATNRGSAHLQVTDFEVAGADVSTQLRSGTSKYVLPGSRMSWTLPAPPGLDRHSPFAIHGHSDLGEFTADAASSGP